ncbi:heavy metal translocating P-type ATPase [Coriobacterium glomerans PW2]|uniref:Heavy metal translocating P-type ATPase n=2 Tax=Coriobacterium TaxID=33870 RepID=F2N7B5_CORGP|nr:heavy metal translocating P-type ATPase [Coriobacterium glomerans PW2]
MRSNDVLGATGSYAGGTASVTCEDTVDLARIESSVRRCGFSLPRERVTIECGASPAGRTTALERLTADLREVFGVASVQRDHDRIDVELWPVGVRAAELLACARAGGIEARITAWDAREQEAAQDAQISELKRLVVAAVLTAPLMWNPAPWIQLALATAVEFGPGRVFWRGAWRSLLAGHLGMDVLVVISTLSVYAHSAWISLTAVSDIQLYFMSQCLLVTLILFGRYLEGIARGETMRSLRALITLQPRRAFVERAGGPREVDVDELVAGDELIVRSGERIAADGIVLAGELVVDESMLTGESAPQVRRASDEVSAGTLNRAGTGRVSVSALGARSRLGQIIEAVQRAQASRAPIQELADRIAGWFVPLVIGAGAATFAVWYLLAAPGQLALAILAACGVLIVACPCALGLATPTCVMVGTGRAAELGILFRDATQLQRACEITRIVFDKTGTLTYGAPEVSAVIPRAGFTQEELIALAAAAERDSSHPFADAIIKRAVGSERGAAALPMPASEFAERVGLGVEATVAGHRVAVGGRALMAELGVESARSRSSEPAAGIRSRVRVIVDGVLAGEILIADAVRGEAVSCVRELTAMGVRCVLATGDERRIAEAVGASIGVAEVRANVTPAGKEALVRELKEDGGRVAVVGDGVNDAPALAAADVSFAMGGGVDVARDAAGIVLVGGRLASVPRAIRLSGQVMRTVRGNLAWALAYNAGFVPLAAAGVVNPSLAAAAMSVSSIIVLMRSLRLRRARA